jgi:DNA adenine methylase
MNTTSPLRYPGGKACLAGVFCSIIDLNGLRGCDYFEPFAGGAGAAIELLRGGVVAEIHINDADLRISAFWEAAVQDTDRFVEKIFEVPLTMEEWSRQERICANPKGKSRFDIGFSAFYMNRCNRSGVMKGAGPIGGKAQAGKWRLGVRFYRETLAARVLALGRIRDRIHISNEDAMVFLKSRLPRGRGRGRVIVFLDPPYVNKGQRLYLNSYAARDHVALANYMNSQKVLPWVMTYDDTDLIRQLYSSQRVFPMPIRYSLNQKVKASELLIAPARLHLPISCQHASIKPR